MLKYVAGFFAVLLAIPFMDTAANQALAQARPFKIGYTDHELIIVNMPQYRQIQQRLQQEYVSEQEELQARSQEFQEKLERYQKQQPVLSEQSRAEREEELVQLQTELQQSAMEKEQKLQQREAELMRPILEQVQQAIDEVARQQSLDLVLRSQIGMQPVILYVNEDTMVDITRDVARRLGIDVEDEQSASAAPSSN